MSRFDLPGDDSEVIQQVYASMPPLQQKTYRKDPEFTTVTPQEFALNIGYRVHTEWERGEGKSEALRGQLYNGEAFEKWVADEEFCRNKTRSLDRATIRTMILTAVAQRAYDLFRSWDGNTSPPFDRGAYSSDGRNLRDTLEPYVVKQESTAEQTAASAVRTS